MDTIQTEIVVIGAGPGGYAAAFYAADRGHRVLLVERDERLGGVCLNRGCIPSKALLHATEAIPELEASRERGIDFGHLQIDLERLRTWKDGLIRTMADGIRTLAKGRGVEVLHGRGRFEESRSLRVETDDGTKTVRYERAIVAVGSRPALPRAFDVGDPRVMTSTEALAVEEIPKRLLVVGGGYIGLELGTVYARLGSDVVIVEALDSLLTGTDSDLRRPIKRRADALFREIRVKTQVESIVPSEAEIKAVIRSEGGATEESYDRVLVAVGRRPNADDLGIERTRIERDERGFIQVDERQATRDPSIYAIGDVVGGAMLAHKAAREARIAVDTIDGRETPSDDLVIPAVVFTDPEIAWAGLTETEAKARRIDVTVARFPWQASGRAQTLGRTDGLTKLILDPATDRVLGVGIVGVGAGELIGEGVLAIQMGATAADLAGATHPHPTLSETLMEAAEAYYGFATHTAARRRRKSSRRARIDAGADGRR